MLLYGRFDADAYLAAYLSRLCGNCLPKAAAAVSGGSAATGAPSPDAAETVSASWPNEDLWVDEGHRILLHNCVAGGATPYAAGLDDCCLTGLCLATPLALAYAGSRDAAQLGARALLQFTHKSEDMARQAALWGDLLVTVLAAAAAARGNSDGDGGAAVIERAIVAAAAAFSDGRVDLDEAAEAFPCDASVGSDVGSAGEVEAAMHASDAAAFHGPRARFSLR